MNTITTSAAVQEEQSQSIERFESRQELEQIVRSKLATSKQSSMDAATALAKIVERKLYKPDFANFNEYCKAIFGFNRDYGYRLISASNIKGEILAALDAEIVSNGYKTPDLNEGQLRELAKVPPEKRVEVLKKAMAKGKVTAKTLVEVSEVPAQNRGGLYAQQQSAKALQAESVTDAEVTSELTTFLAKPGKSALLADLDEVQRAFLHPNSSHNPGTVRALVARFVELVEKHL